MDGRAAAAARVIDTSTAEGLQAASGAAAATAAAVELPYTATSAQAEAACAELRSCQCHWVAYRRRRGARRATDTTAAHDYPRRLGARAAST